MITVTPVLHTAGQNYPSHPATITGMNITIGTPEVKKALQELRPHLSEVAGCRLTYDDVIGILLATA